jgi:cytochrome c oxidase subunit 3
MSFLSNLMSKPWEHAGEMDGLHGGEYITERPAGRTGLYLFLAVITSMFLLFSISHQMRASYPDWRAVAEPGILWFNTGILVFASITLQLARNASLREAWGATKVHLALSMILTMLFIGGQILAWQEMIEAGFFARNNPANAFFYMFTAIHALHLIGGLWFLAGAIRSVIRKPVSEALPLRVGLCATYWHYLLLVWALLFYLLLSS